MNILAQKETMSSSELNRFNRLLQSESIIFNSLKEKGLNVFQRRPIKINGKFYIEQLQRNTNGTFSLVNVLVSKIKEGKFIEQTYS